MTPLTIDDVERVTCVRQVCGVSVVVLFLCTLFSRFAVGSTY